MAVVATCVHTLLLLLAPPRLAMALRHLRLPSPPAPLGALASLARLGMALRDVARRQTLYMEHIL